MNIDYSDEGPSREYNEDSLADLAQSASQKEQDQVPPEEVSKVGVDKKVERKSRSKDLSSLVEVVKSEE